VCVCFGSYFLLLRDCSDIHHLYPRTTTSTKQATERKWKRFQAKGFLCGVFMRMEVRKVGSLQQTSMHTGAFPSPPLHPVL
jgi:hypothetical protein